jgi:RNA polymerase-interacting CarD/CdnL/TRCF family regulator
MAAKALSFDVGDYVVYPKHGVGRVIELQSTDIAGMQLELYVLRFEKEKMTLRVPTNKAESVGHAQAFVRQDDAGGARHPQGQAQGEAHHVVAPRPGI